MTGMNYRKEHEYSNCEEDVIVTIHKLLKTTSLTDLLKTDRKNEEYYDQRVQWFHEQINRETAENILKKGFKSVEEADSEGLFLVRKDDQKYSLSLYCKCRINNYIIEEVDPCYFQIDKSKKIHGLDALIEYFCESENGLPTKLTKFCAGASPPIETRKTGHTNLLHRAVLEGDPAIVKDILNHELSPNINAKNQWGATALHDASECNDSSIVRLLLERKCNVNITDAQGQTALQRAALKGHLDMLSILHTYGKTDPLARNPENGCVALHDAAHANKLECVKKLLEISHCPFPRNQDDKTPYDLASSPECKKCFENYKLPDCAKMELWIHSELDRKGAEKTFEPFGSKDGVFLIRNHTKKKGFHVLSLWHFEKFTNYEIEKKSYLNYTVYYIDNGPYLLNLEHLVYYYRHHSDGLPCTLKTAVTTSNSLSEVPIDVDQEYYIIPRTAQKHESRAAAVIPKSKTDADPVYATPHDDASPPSPRVPTTKPPHLHEPEPEKPKLIEIPEKHIKLAHQLGEGEYGVVMYGTLTEKGGIFHKKVAVAVKTFHEGSIVDQNDFLREAYVSQNLNHPYITKLKGVCHGKEQLMLVQEYVPMGSMLVYLQDHALEKSQNNVPLLLWSQQIAEGMLYLESEKLVHRDLAARNILLASISQIKISDFGLSRATGGDSDYYQAKKGGKWPVKWYAPESVCFGKFTHKSDVWGYGVTMWEIFSFGESPYGDKTGSEVIQDIEKGRRLSKPDNCSTPVFQIMKQCWEKVPEKRPSFQDLVESIKKNKKE